MECGNGLTLRGNGRGESDREIRLPSRSPKQRSLNSTSESGLQIIIPRLRGGYQRGAILEG